MNIGFIGLGIMGKPMCINLMKAGFSVTAWNRSPEKMTDVIHAGAAAGHSPQHVAEQSDIIIAIVSDSPDVEQVVLGDQTIDPALVVEVQLPRGQISK